MTDADYKDNLLANAPAQAKSLQYNLEQKVLASLWTNKTEFVCFKQYEAIFTFSSKPLKLEDQFTYLSSNILSPETNINIHIGKASTVIDNIEI